MTVPGNDTTNPHRPAAARPRTHRAPGSYLVIIRDPRLAEAVAAALESGLATRDHDEPVLVPPLRGCDFTGARYGRAVDEWCAAQDLPEGRRVLVALHEEGLYADLARLGACAVVGVPPQDRDRAQDGLGEDTVTVAVTTIGDFVRAVLDQTLRRVRPGRSRATRRPDGAAAPTVSGARPARRLTIVTTSGSARGAVPGRTPAGPGALPPLRSTIRPGPAPDHDGTTAPADGSGVYLLSAGPGTGWSSVDGGGTAS